MPKRRTLKYAEDIGAHVEALLHKFLIRRWRASVSTASSELQSEDRDPSQFEFWVRLFDSGILPEKWGDTAIKRYRTASYFAQCVWFGSNQAIGMPSIERDFEFVQKQGGDFATELFTFLTKQKDDPSIQERIRLLHRAGLATQVSKPPADYPNDDELKVLDVFFNGHPAKLAYFIGVVISSGGAIEDAELAAQIRADSQFSRLNEQTQLPNLARDVAVALKRLANSNIFIPPIADEIVAELKANHGIPVSASMIDEARKQLAKQDAIRRAARIALFTLQLKGAVDPQ